MSADPSAPAPSADAETPASASPVDVAPRRRTGTKPPRRRSRELAMQGLYQWLLASAEPNDIIAHIATMDGFERRDRELFDALLHGSIEHAAAIDEMLQRFIDRPLEQLSPVEHAVMMIGVYELMHHVEVPYRVALNEAVELAKTFGGTDGHKYVNGVLHKAAAALRPNERG